MLQATDSTTEIRHRVAKALTQSGIATQYNNREGVITPNSQTVLKKRYLAKNPKGEIIEDTDGLFRRVAHNLAQADANYGATVEEIQETEDKIL